jgi:hypothetical protein
MGLTNICCCFLVDRLEPETGLPAIDLNLELEGLALPSGLWYTALHRSTPAGVRAFWSNAVAVVREARRLDGQVGINDLQS